MVILGSLLLGADYSYEMTPTYINDINNFDLEKGIYDGIYASEDTSLPLTYELKEDWDVNTIFASNYTDTIDASNVDFSLSTISHIAVKKRRANTFKWTTLLVKKINTLDDLKIIDIDIFNAGNTDYQYALVPLINNIEGGYNIVEAHSDFDGLYLLEKDTIYGTILDIKCDTERNHSVICQKSSYNRYPRALYNSLSNYESGSVQGYFCKYDANKCEYYTEDSVNYRRDLVDFLTDQKPKILKLYDGRIWLVNIDADSITDTEDGHWQHRMTSFRWFESGDYNNERDLYDAGLIDIDSAYWSYEV